MKNDNNLIIRLPSNLKQEFVECTTDIGISYSKVLRQFMINYIKHFNNNGNEEKDSG